MCFCSEVLIHARQVSYHWATPPAPAPVSWIDSSCCWGSEDLNLCVEMARWHGWRLPQSILVFANFQEQLAQAAARSTGKGRTVSSKPAWSA